MNGARFIVKSLSKNLVQLQFMNGKFENNMVFIPKIMLQPTDTDYPFILNRIQFPIINAFALTINKSQGQTFKKVGIYLSSDVFGHGQLYVAFSRAISKQSVVVQLINNDYTIINNNNNKNFTYNCVYHEIFNETLFV